MANKQINARVALKHDIEENWITAGEHGFCPMAGEVIIYDIQEGVCSQLRYKIGRKDSNGQLININDLPFETNLYVGTTEPVDTPVGFMWLDTSDEVKLITFYLDIYNLDAYNNGTITESKEYVAEEGMTFRDWVNSSYNTDHWYCLLFDAINGEYEEPGPDHSYGIGRVLYNDGSYGDVEGSGTTEYIERMVTEKKFPTWDTREEYFYDCEIAIQDKQRYWMMRYYI